MSKLANVRIQSVHLVRMTLKIGPYGFNNSIAVEHIFHNFLVCEISPLMTLPIHKLLSLLNAIGVTEKSRAPNLFDLSTFYKFKSKFVFVNLYLI